MTPPLRRLSPSDQLARRREAAHAARWSDGVYSNSVIKRCALISVDLQNDFASEGGRIYSPKPCLAFLRTTLFPYLETAGLQVSEIVSDYRQPRPGYTRGCCEPGDWGHESIVPARLTGSRLTKSMNSPVWTREGIGEADEEPGLPYSDPERFTAWLESGLGRPSDVVPVVFGLTVDCCVLCVCPRALLAWIRDIDTARGGRLC
jgi:hypothetical protein